MNARSNVLTFKRLALTLAAVLVCGAAMADDLFIYPTKGQNAETQDRDRYECHRWAVQQTGFDPSKPSAPPAPASSGSDRRPGPLLGRGSQPNAVRGAARGSALGAVGGAIAGNAGKGAAA